ncbi:MAG: hypothetical protein AAFR87_24345 [Bacteroidota bacterium]
MIFNLEDIKEDFEEYASKSIPFESEAYFRQNDFNKPQSEESLASLIAMKSEILSIRLFWIKAYQKILDWEEVLEEGETMSPDLFIIKTQKISQSGFFRAKHEMFTNLATPPDLLAPSYKAYQLKNEWNQRIFLLENETKYQLVYWDTTV